MTRTFDVAARDRGAAWCVLIRIEGIGDTGGQWVFTTQNPGYVNAQGYDSGNGNTYLPWISEWPQLLSEKMDPLGGIPDIGGLDFALLDYGDRLTGQLGMDGPPIAAVRTAMSTSTNALSATYGAFIVGQILFIGSEVVQVYAMGGGGTYSVTRGLFGTDAVAHAVGEVISLSLPYLRSRRVTLHMVNVDAPDAGSEQLFGTYYIDGYGLSQDLNGYTFTTRGQLKYLARMIPRTMLTYRAQPFQGSTPNQIELSATQSGQTNVTQYYSGAQAWLASSSGELTVTRPIGTLWANGLTRRVTLDRAQCGTPTGNGLDELTQVMCAFVNPSNRYPSTANGNGSFRYSPGSAMGGTPSTAWSDSSGEPTSWYASDHPIDLLLCMLTSSFVASDGMLLTNSDATYGNWSSLPVGFGLGVPATLIDFPSFLAIRSRYQDWHLPFFFYGHKPEVFADLVTREILQPFGISLVTTNGKIYAAVPQIPLAANAVAAITTDDILLDKEEGRAGLPRFAMTLSADSQIAAVMYKCRFLSGQESVLGVHNGDYGSTYGQQGYYASDEKTLALDIAANASDGQTALMLYHLGATRMFRFAKPTLTVTLQVALSFYTLKPADVVSVTIPEAPEFSTATRGWTARLCEVVSRTVIVDPDGGARIELGLIGYPSTKIGKIAPAAVITGVSANAMTCVANRYTDANNVLGLATSDATAFTVGDVVGLHNLDLSLVSILTQRVTATTGNILTLDGNFGALAAAGLVIRYAQSGGDAAQQTASYAFFGDDAYTTVPTPWRFSDG